MNVSPKTPGAPCLSAPILTTPDRRAAPIAKRMESTRLQAALALVPLLMIYDDFIMN